MDPVTLAAIGAAASQSAPFITAGATAIGAYGSYQAQRSQASEMQQRAAIEAENADVRAKEGRAEAQDRAAIRMREANLAQSRLKASAGASGSSSSDPTIMDLWTGIEQEGQINAGREMARGESRAQGITYQSDLNRWSADANARIKKAAATSTLIGGIGDSIGGFSRMRARYGGYQGQSTLAYPGTQSGWKTTVRYG